MRSFLAPGYLSGLCGLAAELPRRLAEPSQRDLLSGLLAGC